MSFRMGGGEFTLTASAVDIDLDLGPDEGFLVSSATVCNTDSTTRTVTIHLASNGGAAATGNKVEDARTCAPNQATNTALSGKTLKPGAKIWALASVTDVCILSITGTIVPQAA